MKKIHELGNKYGKLTAIAEVDQHDYAASWLCRCECGKLCTVKGIYLRSGYVKSCGCLPVGSKPIENSGSAKNQVYAIYKKSAAIKGVKFTLTFEEFLKITSLPCYYCGALPSNVKRAPGGDFTYQGIDREDNTEGYTRSNSCPCCSICNNAKGIKSNKEFLSWILKVYRYSIKPLRET